MNEPYRRSTLALAVLGLLAGEPMHPYRMQQVIKQRAKDQVVNVGQRASLYKAVDRLRKASLVAARETTRNRLRPERTVYELTDHGRQVLERWMREVLSLPAREFPVFPAAIAFLPLLTPGDVCHELEQRLGRLRKELARLEQGLADARVPRLLLLEDEYRRAVTAAELAWVESLVEDLRAGRIVWDERWLREVAAATGGAPAP